MASETTTSTRKSDNGWKQANSALAILDLSSLAYAQWLAMAGFGANF